MRAITVAFVLAVGCGGARSDAPARSDDAPLVAAYLAIGDALAHDGTEGVREHGQRLRQAAQAERDAKGADAIVTGSEHIDATDIEDARAAFKIVSAGMIEWMRAHPDTQPGKMIVHCPMTFGGKGGLWVQPEGKIMNPYEGARMLQCGDKLDWAAELPPT